MKSARGIQRVGGIEQNQGGRVIAKLGIEEHTGVGCVRRRVFRSQGAEDTSLRKIMIRVSHILVLRALI